MTAVLLLLLIADPKRPPKPDPMPPAATAACNVGLSAVLLAML